MPVINSFVEMLAAVCHTYYLITLAVASVWSQVQSNLLFIRDNKVNLSSPPVPERELVATKDEVEAAGGAQVERR